MRVTVAMDSFKGSLTSLAAGSAVKEGILRAIPDAEVTVRPLADGGEGTVAALAAGLGGQPVQVTVAGPRLAPVCATYCRIGKDTAVIEMAAAAGLPLLSPDQQDPMVTTTLGVGQLIAHAISAGCRRFIIGIGGSATNDGGTGMLSALGFSFLDADGMPIPPGARGLEKLHSIRTDDALSQLAQCTFEIACDVTNPLCGSNGCSAVFAPQKGAAPANIPKMDLWLERYAALTKQLYPHADKNHPGAGAAGGMGFAFLSYLNATLQPGSHIIARLTELDRYIAGADIVITGEGRMDGQSVLGKAPMAVAALGKKHGKQVIAFCGCATEDADICLAHGIDAYYPVIRQTPPPPEALLPENAYNNLLQCVCRVFRQLPQER